MQSAACNRGNRGQFVHADEHKGRNASQEQAFCIGSIPATLPKNIMAPFFAFTISGATSLQDRTPRGVHWLVSISENARPTLVIPHNRNVMLEVS